MTDEPQTPNETASIGELTLALFVFSAPCTGGYLNVLVAADDGPAALARLQRDDPMWNGPNVQTQARGRHPKPPEGVLVAVKEGHLGFWVSQPEEPPIVVTDEMLAAGVMAFTAHGGHFAKPRVNENHIVREVYWAMAQLARAGS